MGFRDLLRDVSLAGNHLSKVPKLIGACVEPSTARLLARNAWHAAGPAPRPRALGPREIDRRIERCLSWIELSQDTVGSGGIGCDELYRWTPGYPEVTGYTIPTMWRAHRRSGQAELAERALAMTEWELSIQRPDGGWEGCYQGDGMPSIVFNTAQVIRGMIATYTEVGDQRFLDAAVRAADWIVGAQEPDGSWAQDNFKKMRRVYDTYSCSPLATLHAITGHDAYRRAVMRNIEFVEAHQRPNGWFELADNLERGCDAPVTHTLAYTIDGLLECGELLADDSITKMGRASADAVLELVDDGRLAARFDENWRPRSGSVCNTGSCQMGVVAMRLFRATGDRAYRNTARDLAGFTAAVQDINALPTVGRDGIPGSFPIWGTYCPMKFPSWATKYFLDLLLDLSEPARSNSGPVGHDIGEKAESR